MVERKNKKVTGAELYPDDPVLAYLHDGYLKPEYALEQAMRNYVQFRKDKDETDIEDEYLRNRLSIILSYMPDSKAEMFGYQLAIIAPSVSHRWDNKKLDSLYRDMQEMAAIGGHIDAEKLVERLTECRKTSSKSGGLRIATKR